MLISPLTDSRKSELRRLAVAIQDILATRVQFQPVIKGLKDDHFQLDLSINNPDLPSNGIFADPASWIDYIAGKRRESGKHFGVGGYRERRCFYASQQYHVPGEARREWHLGFDAWGPATTPVHAPLPGRVHSFSYDPDEGSYGATILLHHRLAELEFYTLYGHLARADLDTLVENDAIAAGQAFAHFGEPTDNGNWPPHLHFQLILDPLDWRGDFPGVWPQDQLEDGCLLCPDPTRLLGLPLSSFHFD